MKYIVTDNGIYDNKNSTYFKYDGVIKAAPYCADYEVSPERCIFLNTEKELPKYFKRFKVVPASLINLCK